MAVYFFDTSALVIRYVNETGSAWVESIAGASGNEVYLVGMTELELTSAAIRRCRGSSLTPAALTSVLSQFRQDLQSEYQVLAVTSSLYSDAITLIEMHGLRANDAVQLAGVLALNAERTANTLPEAVLVSADLELNAAATAEGLAVEDPNAHP